MVLSHSHEEEYIPHIQTQFPMLQLAINSSRALVTVSFTEADPSSSRSSLWRVEDGLLQFVTVFTGG